MENPDFVKQLSLYLCVLSQPVCASCMDIREFWEQSFVPLRLSVQKRLVSLF